MKTTSFDHARAARLFANPLTPRHDYGPGSVGASGVPVGTRGLREQKELVDGQAGLVDDIRRLPLGISSLRSRANHLNEVLRKGRYLAAGSALLSQVR